MLTGDSSVPDSVTTTIGNTEVVLFGAGSEFFAEQNSSAPGELDGTIATLTAEGFDQPFNYSGFEGHLIFLDDEFYGPTSLLPPSVTSPYFEQVNDRAGNVFGFQPSGGVFGGGVIDITDISFDPISDSVYGGPKEFGTFSPSSILVSVDDGVQTTGGGANRLPPTGVPEPTTWALMLIGTFGLGAALRARRAASSIAPA
jgi:hypothetical protein